MKKMASLLALATLAIAGLDARAQVSSTITLASDYDFRGITQTARDPALSASLDYSAPSGFHDDAVIALALATSARYLHTHAGIMASIQSVRTPSAFRSRARTLR